jgi:hypothetical protein
VARGYYLKRNAILVILIFVWVTTLLGFYRFNLLLVTSLFLGTVLAYAILKNLHGQFRDKRHYFLAVAAIDNLAVTIAMFLMGGTGSAQIFTFYLYPLIYHSLSRSRALIYLIANMAAVMCSTMIALEWFELIPRYDIFGFGRPHDTAYPGLILGAFLFLNIAAMVCDRITRVFVRLEDQLAAANHELEQLRSPQHDPGQPTEPHRERAAPR